jgi:hydrogenase-4 membrane subunit HyfE
MRLPAALVRSLTFAAAVIVTAAFFLPWMDGANELRFHSFSGFDFARLIRNFEITAQSPSETGQIRATALLIYLMPALVVNSCVMTLLQPALKVAAKLAGGALIAAGGYGLAVLGVLLFLSVVRVNDFADVVGGPDYGFAISAGASALLLGLGVSELRSSSVRSH